MKNNSIVCLLGPTASGKSYAAMALANRWPIEIINLNSATIYRGMDIGTAKPTKYDQCQVQQHLLDIREPYESYSAAEFTYDAAKLIKQIIARNRIPIITGGTMFYHHALFCGLSCLPRADYGFREQLKCRAMRLGWPVIHEKLSKIDPISAEKISHNDGQRIQRALEIYFLTGRKMSSIFKKHRSRQHRYHCLNISLEPSDRKILHERIVRRFDQMLEYGFLDEVISLHSRYDLHMDMPSVRCVGYRQLLEYIYGWIGLAQAREKGIAATRQLARRQLIWLRYNKNRFLIDCLDINAVSKIVDCVYKFLPTCNRHSFYQN